MPKGEPTVINPYAIISSIESRYNAALAAGISDPGYYHLLQREADSWASRWETELADGTGIRGFGSDVAQQIIGEVRDLSTRLVKASDNAGFVQYGRARDQFVSSQGDPDALAREMYDLIKNQGMSLEDAVRVMAESGQYDLTDLQRVAYRVGDPNFDPGAAPAPGMAEGDTGVSAPGFGGSGFKPNEPVAQDITSPQEEFQKGFSLFTRQLETSLQGKAPQLSALSERYQDLFNKYLGEIEARKGRGEEPANVFKEAFVNIGKSTDPQFDQETDRMQLQTVRPGLSAFDFLLKNVDPEDILASTPFEQRPGRSTGGFRGYVRRLNA